MDLFDLVAKITLDTSGYKKGIDDAEGETEKLGDKIKRGLGAVGKVVGAGVSVAATGVGILGKQAVEAYANYEQLVGGVETLFKDSSGLVQEYAANAYKTAGLSANEYMETVTGFSASLLQSLGGDTEAAAKVGDMAIRDMSDNANKMGTSMESIQNAYQGFAKQNYTMLDNLKLGYGGTKEEMERLLQDATAISGVEYDIDSLSDVYEAIHVIQGELDITGTTSKEASETISGSVTSMKSAWQNLVVGIADDNADFETLIGNFTESVGTAAENILPRISVALQGIGKLVEGLAPVISEAIVVLATEVLPPLLESAMTLLRSVINALLENLPQIIDTALQMVLALADGIVQYLPEIIPAVVEVILTIVDKLTQPDMLSQLIDAALRLIMALADGLINAIPRLIKVIPTIIVNLVTALIREAPKILSAGVQLIGALAKGIGSAVGSIVKAVGSIVSKIREAISGVISSALGWGKDLLDNFIGGIKSKIGALVDSVKGVAGKVRSFLGFSEPDEGPLSNFHTYAPDMMELFAKGIRDNEHLITDQIAKSFDFGNDIANIGLTGNGTASGGTTNTFGAVSISIYPREGQDADEIADAVMERIQFATERKAAAVT